MAINSLLRKEDRRLLTGRARFTDDVHLDRMLEGVFIRSPIAHAMIARIDASAAIKAGALLVLTGPDLPFNDRRFLVRYWHPSIKNGLPPFLAMERVRYVGEPVAFVVAEDRYLAEDFAALVEIEYSALGPVASASAAMASKAVLLHDGWHGNIAAQFKHAKGDTDAAFGSCAGRVKRYYRYARQIPLPLEGRGCVADYAADQNQLTVQISTQSHYNVRDNLAKMLDLAESNVRVIAQDVGGGFGSKSRTYPEEIVVSHASMRLGRPVKWIEDRFENLHATTHSRSMDTELEIGYDANAKIVALKERVVVDIGAYVHTSGIVTAEIVAARCAGPYKIENVSVEVVCVGTNKTPIATYRGAGQPEATFPLETALDVVAKELDISSIEIRRRNIITPVDMPYVSSFDPGPARSAFENGDFPRMLEMVATGTNYDESLIINDRGERVGWGLACGVEASGFVNYESAKVSIDPSGQVMVLSGISSQGQGQRTTYAQVCAETLGVRFEDVHVRVGDTGLLAFGRGGFASRGAILGANAVAGASEKLRHQVLSTAATLLQAAPGELCIRDGAIYRNGNDAGLSVGKIAAAIKPGGVLYSGALALEAEHIFDTKDLLTLGLSIHAAQVAVDSASGFFRVLDYRIVHDAGRMLNPMIVEGQVIGGAVEGIGSATLSEISYDSQAQPLDGTLADYLVITAPEAPRVHIQHVDSRSSTNPLGVRGVGEGGLIPVPSAIANAISRAIDPKAVGHEMALSKLPITPEMVFRALALAQNGDLQPSPWQNEWPLR
jgi:aerobic carbon-monoxide dehydrogenase large subunit